MQTESKKLTLPIKVFDFFSGCGGTSKGFQNAGMDIVFALDNDPDSERTFTKNFPNAKFERKNIRSVSEDILTNLITENSGHPILFSGCAPCQPFTRQNTQRTENQEQIFLLKEFQRFIEFHLPDYVFVENVPGLQNVAKEKGPFTEFVTTLKEKEYQVDYKVIASKNFGVPQRRRRLVLIASRLGKIEFPKETHGPNTDNLKFSSVAQWIKDLPALKAGESHPTIPNHIAAGLSETNLQRLQATPPGGSRTAWPEDLVLACHSGNYQGHSDVYGRMKWGEPASGLTTRCISLSNGRFGHPEQNRAISVREAACLQTFPRDFVFEGSLNSTARQIGNAVPVILAQKFGENFINHFLEVTKGE